MAIDPSNAPTAAVEAVHQALASRVAKSAFSPSNLLRADASGLSLSMPHRVAYLPFANIEPGVSLRKIARIGNWRFLVHEKQSRMDAGSGAAAEKEKHVPIAAATAAKTKGAKYELSDLNEGPFVEGTEKAIRIAEGLEEVRKGNFEAFLLVVSTVYVVALWLQDRDGDADILLTIPPVNRALVPYRPMTQAAFLDTIRGMAKKTLSPTR